MDSLVYLQLPNMGAFPRICTIIVYLHSEFSVFSFLRFYYKVCTNTSGTKTLATCLCRRPNTSSMTSSIFFPLTEQWYKYLYERTQQITVIFGSTVVTANTSWFKIQRPNLNHRDYVNISCKCCSNDRLLSSRTGLCYFDAVCLL